MSEIWKEFEEWFAAQCDGAWEEEFGVDIQTSSNPGWSAKIALSGTSLEWKPFPKVKLDRSEHDWVHCWREGNEWRGAGGPRNLSELLRAFLNWAQEE